MSHYRKIDVRIWNDAKFQSLSDNGKLAFFLLLTHPNMTALGAMRGTPAGLGADLSCSPEAFREAFQEVLAKGMAEYDESARLIALPNFVKYNPPINPNVLKAWAHQVEYLPECDLKTVVLQRAKAFAEGMGEAFAKAFLKAFPEALPNTLSTEHGGYPSQGRGVSGLGRAGGRRPALAVVNGDDGSDGL
jgi:hypothetical protein